MGIKRQLQENQSKNQSRQLSVVFREISQPFSGLEVFILETEEVVQTPSIFMLVLI